VATIGLLHERSMRESNTLNEQMQTALNSRVVIEQAKGKLAERFGLDMDRAFSVLRNNARTRNLRLAELAQAFVDGTETIPGRGGRPPRRPPGTRAPRPGPGA
jgi:AmiR/NasT family two-component response regulator